MAHTFQIRALLQEPQAPQGGKPEMVAELLLAMAIPAIGLLVLLLQLL